MKVHVTVTLQKMFTNHEWIKLTKLDQNTMQYIDGEHFRRLWRWTQKESNKTTESNIML